MPLGQNPPIPTEARIPNTGYHIRSSTNTSTSTTGPLQHHAKDNEITSPPHSAMNSDETIPHSKLSISRNGTDHSYNAKEPPSPSIPTHDHSSLLKLQPFSHNSKYLNVWNEQSCDTPTKAFLTKNTTASPG